ncbi:hypothetical protein NZL82_10505 [Sphingomonas sanguinis]|uniref:hypothetical protein n=1 Tax=Sphingomonas sp. LC-1 TaxID=3110957 RepID=UPI0021BA4DE2|nr:hypothetical protein [Sphingomonas sp. LC-1]MCT8002310.1 hypothetical protein [Sphingomonas sp. LC-1]
MIRFVAFWSVAILWLAVALPILLWSVVTLEIPLWPEFSAESTSEGMLVWAIVAAFFYFAPILLFLNKKAGRRPSKLMVANAEN